MDGAGILGVKIHDPGIDLTYRRRERKRGLMKYSWRRLNWIPRLNYDAAAWVWREDVSGAARYPFASSFLDSCFSEKGSGEVRS